ncbi:MAG: hypothetical protein IRZ08_11535, partial [Frankia sp.]|nr:hypothetical protein [Frankia sp.]
RRQWAAGAVPPEYLLVDGARVGPGSRVRLRPRRSGADVQDMFLDGHEAVVEEVRRNLEGEPFLAVTLVDDPGADLLRWHGHRYYFSPDEVEVISPAAGAAAPAREPGR